MQISNYGTDEFVAVSDVCGVFGYVTVANAFRLLQRKRIPIAVAGEGSPTVLRSDIMQVISGGSYTPAQRETFVERLRNVPAVVGGLEKAVST